MNTSNAGCSSRKTFIVEMAGGVVSGFTGEANYLFGRELLAGNTSGHAGMLKVIKTYFGENKS
ncbi:hypothetical protein MASR1M74_04450 [Lentimicrobium sp.]